MTAGQLQVGRTTLLTGIVQSSRSRGVLELECWHRPGTGISDDDHEVVRAIRNDLQGQIGDLIPLVWDGPAFLTGWYVLREAEVGTIDPGRAFPCNLTLEYFGSANEVKFESRLVGKVKTNDFSVTDSSSEPFVAPPPHVNFDPRHATTTARKIAGESDLTVYRDVSLAIDPKWSCEPEDWYIGAATVQRRMPLYPEMGPIGGTDGFFDALEDVELNNGAVRFWYSADGLFYVGFWDGTAWRDKGVYFVAEGLAVPTWNSVAIIENRPEKCSLRYEGGTTGRVTLDVSLRRGAMGVSTLLTVDTAGTLGVYDALLTDVTVTSNRAVYTAADANGHKLILASPRAFGNTAADGYIWKASSTQFQAFVGMELSGAAVGNQAAALVLQYMAAVSENVRALRR